MSIANTIDLLPRFLAWGAVMRVLVFGILLFSQVTFTDDLVFCSMDSVQMVLDAKQPALCKAVSGNSTLELCEDKGGTIALPSGMVMRLFRVASGWNARTDVQDFSANTVSSTTLALRKNEKEFLYNEKVLSSRGQTLKSLSCSGTIK